MQAEACIRIPHHINEDEMGGGGRGDVTRMGEKTKLYRCLLDRASCDSRRIKNQLGVTCYYCFSSWRLNMFRALICPSSGACDCVV